MACETLNFQLIFRPTAWVPLRRMRKVWSNEPHQQVVVKCGWTYILKIIINQIFVILPVWILQSLA